MERILILFIGLFMTLSWGQNKDKSLFEGTQSFESKKYREAEKEFRISQSKKGDNESVANYNLGNSIYRLNQAGEAKYKYLDAIEGAKTKEEKHKAYHNLGNTLMLEENYAAAAEAYKNALRNNPLDDETRYNYALARKKQKENPPKKDDKGNDKKQDQDQNQQNNQDQKEGDGKDKKDKKDNGKDQDKKDSDQGKEDQKKDQGKDQKDKGDGDKEEDQKGNPKPTGANKQEIENLLNAVNNAEKKIQDKLNAKKVKARPSTNEKDW